jgi:hypothetical protein
MVEFEVKKSEEGEVSLEAFIDENKNHKRVKTEYIQ